MKKTKTAPPSKVARTRTVERARGEDLHVQISDALPRMERLGPPDSAAPRAVGNGRYVYGVIESKEAANFGKFGIGGGGEAVYTVTHKDISAIVSKTELFIFDPTRENALAHEHVIETV